MKYDLFSLMDWTSIPPQMTEYVAGDDVFVLPTGLSLYRIHRGIYCIDATNNVKLRNILEKDRFYDSRFESVAQLYRYVANKIRHNQDYLSANHLRIKGGPKVAFNKSDEIFASFGVVKPEGIGIIASRSHKGRVALRYYVPVRLRKYNGGEIDVKKTLVHEPQAQAAHMQEILDLFAELNKTFIEMLLADFKQSQEQLRNDPTVITR